MYEFLYYKLSNTIFSNVINILSDAVDGSNWSVDISFFPYGGSAVDSPITLLLSLMGRFYWSVMLSTDDIGAVITGKCFSII